MTLAWLHRREVAVVTSAFNDRTRWPLPAPKAPSSDRQRSMSWNIVGLLSVVSLSALLSPALAFVHPALAQQTEKPDASGVSSLHLNRYVPTGVEQQIDFVTSVAPDCSALTVTPRVMAKALHGQVQFAEADAFGFWPSPNIREKCNDKKVHGLKVMYKSEDGYLGKDELSLFIIFGDSTATQRSYTIDVR